MSDREKVIKGLKWVYQCISPVSNTCGDCPYQDNHVECKRRVLSDALTLLKEKPEIVLCKDCKNACVYDDDEVICTHIDSNGNDKHPADWFCADGQPR